ADVEIGGDAARGDAALQEIDALRIGRLPAQEESAVSVAGDLDLLEVELLQELLDRRTLSGRVGRRGCAQPCPRERDRDAAGASAGATAPARPAATAAAA